MTQEQLALLDAATEAADRADRRNAVIVSAWGLLGVAASGALLLLGEMAL